MLPNGIMEDSRDIAPAFAASVSSPRRYGRIDEIEYLRAVAIVFTLLQHVPILFSGPALAEAPPGSWGGGVDLFFVISGFVITRSFRARLDHADRGALWRVALPFWLRRAWRLLPAAWFWLAASIVAAAIFDASGAFPSVEVTLADAKAAFLQYANLHVYKCYVMQSSICGLRGVPNGIYWSLSLEEQFYVLFPFLVLLLPRRTLTPLLIISAALQVIGDKPGHLIWFLRSDGLAIGVLIALHTDKLARFDPRFLRRRLWRGAAFVLFAALIALLPASPVPHTTGLVTVIAGIWVCCASLDQGYVLPATMLRPVLLWIGTRSYAIYLTHLLAFAVARALWYRIDGEPTSRTAWVCCAMAGFALAALASEFTYRRIEVPCRAIGARITAWAAARSCILRRSAGSTAQKRSTII